MSLDPSIYEIRDLASDEDYRACLQLQFDTWGEDVLECVPPRILKISQHVSSIAAGAFDPAGRLVGFVWGLTGPRQGRLCHWSHMLAVATEARDTGLGRRLKLHQRESLLAVGVEAVYWTYDPLESRNAHLNFNRLGVELDEYKRDYYGSGEGSPLHRGIGTDRFVVVWNLASAHVGKALAGGLPEEPERWEEVPVVNSRIGSFGALLPAIEEIPPLPVLRVEVPASIQAVKGASPETGAAWRVSTRAAFESAFARGLTVKAFYRSAATGRCFYVLC